MKFSYGVEVEGMALEKDYNHIKNFLRFSGENYFITGDESIKICLLYTSDAADE